MITLRGAARAYDDVWALRPTDLEIGPHELVVVLGPSGSGKTTLLNLIGGLDVATEGQVLVDGHDPAALDPTRLALLRRRTVSMVFQSHNLIPNLTAYENVQLAAELTGGTPDVDAALRSVGLADRALHFPHELSGGEQQRIAIARALVKGSPIVLGDEPTGNLDAATGRTILRLFHEAWDRKRCVILVTHNVAVADMATRVIRLHDGTVIENSVRATPCHPDDIVL